MNENQIFNSKEVLAAAADTFAVKFGQFVAKPHPLATELSIKDIALACGEKIRPMQSHETDSNVLARGWSSSDFANLLSATAKVVMHINYQNQADYLNFCKLVEVPDFHLLEIPRIDSDIELLPVSDTSQLERAIAAVTPAATGAKLTSYGRAVIVGRELLYDTRLDSLKEIFMRLGQHAARLETRLVTQALEGNANLNDGSPVFAEEHGNIVTDTLPDGLPIAMKLLRTQLTNTGWPANNAAHSLVVEPTLESTARHMMHEAGLEIKISVLPELPSGRWYLLADPQNAPTIGVLRLAGSKSPIDASPKKLPIQFDGLGLSVTTDTCALMLGRVGIVRGGTV